MIKVTYVDHMGSDLSVVNAARVSFGKNSKPLNHESLGDDPTMIPFLPETDTKLINYLARHHHKSPFNHAFATFQLQKHEYMPWNEISRRYVDDKPDWYWPKDDVWRGRAKDKKQGSEGFIDLKEDKITFFDKY